MEDQQTTLRDALDGAFNEIEQESAPLEQSTPSYDEKPRTPDGKFAAKEASQEEVQQVAEEAPRAPRPSSWKKDYEAQWESLDPELQKYINQREQEYAKGVSTYKNQWDSAAPIYEAMAQHVLPDLQQHGIAPQQWIAEVSRAHKSLTYGSPQEKAQTLMALANNYGVDLGQFTGMPVDQNYSMLAHELAQLRNQWNGFQTMQQQHEQLSINNEIQEFSQDAPHFEAVRETMAGLLESGVAKDLKTAYDKAVRLHDDIWEQMQAQHAQQNTQELTQKAAQARAKAVSPKSAAPTGSGNNGNGKKSTRETLSSLLDEAIQAGRI